MTPMSAMSPGGPRSPTGDDEWIRRALGLARGAAAAGEVPVGAILVFEGRVLGTGSNRPIGACDPTAHAEIVAMREAAARVGNYRLTGAELFVTLEPCLMCFGAAIHARLGRVVFGAFDPRVGASDLIRRLEAAPGLLNHRLEISGGALAAECASLLSGFFEERRDTTRIFRNSGTPARL